MLSNFARLCIERLIADAVPDSATTPEVLRELRDGVAFGHLPRNCDFQWLSVVTLSEEEREILSLLIHEGLGMGESSCIAAAVTRKCGVFTDDKLARRFAQSLALPVSGTLGVPVVLVRKGSLNLQEANGYLSRMYRARLLRTSNQTKPFDLGEDLVSPCRDCLS